MNHVKSYAVKPLLLSVVLLLSLLLLLPASAAGSEAHVFYILANGKSLTVAFADTAAARELEALLDSKDISVDMTGNSFEQYGALGRRFSSNDTQITAQPGDVLLYNGDTICVFYGTNRYAYTRLGSVTNADASQLKALLSGDDLTITLTKTAPKTDTASPQTAEPSPENRSFVDVIRQFLQRLLAFFKALAPNAG